ncbi:LapA family protein [Yoonia sp.]|uniref:LapA family protein n=1 Tax=Yoonia sp. TaxID=2212373 RepID=UPI0019DE768E|nr:LapA family protein [Yoonia sp.]MBE0412931.1 LapA family protein [Yoonia sp.]
MKTIRYAFWAIVGLCLILVGLANRGVVTVRALPSSLAELFGVSPDIALPLFVVIMLGVGAGLLIGFVWEWLREHRQRAEARAQARELAALRQEVAQLRGAAAKTKGDDVLALLDKAS